MWQEDAYPRVWVVVGLAIAGGAVGAIGAAAVLLLEQGGPLGGPDSTELILENARVLTASAFGGGLGWFLGTAVGWRGRGRPSPPSLPTSWVLRAAALAFVVIAFGIVRVIPGGFDSSSYDVRLSYDGAPIQALVILDTVLAVGTLLAVSRRRPFHPRAAIAGATTGAIVLLGAFVVFASLPAVGEAWLQRWLSTRQAPLGAASNLITPASLYCPARVPDNPSDDRSFSSDVPSVYYWINPFAPRWLPDGFGLALDRSWPDSSPHGVWTDERCREVMLVVDGPTRDTKPWSATGERVGGWTLLPPGSCGDPLSGCREYRARGTTDGFGHPVLIVLRTAGLSSDEADRIALSIPLRDVRYI